MEGMGQRVLDMGMLLDDGTKDRLRYRRLHGLRLCHEYACSSCVRQDLRFLTCVNPFCRYEELGILGSSVPPMCYELVAQWSSDCHAAA